MPARRCQIVALALVLILTGVSGAPALTPPQAAGAEASFASPRSAFGVAGAMRWPEWGSFDRPAAALAESGASWAREDFVWGLIEPHEGQKDYTATDRLVGALRQRGISILGIISYSANWATPSKADDASPTATSFYMPDLSKYYWFVRSLVDRYRRSVHYWEVWNEPNGDTFWKPAPSAKEYAELLKTAYKAVKDADPTARVLTGGMSGNAIPFLEEMIAAGAESSFDILALHPYAIPLNEGNARIESRPDAHRLVEIELYKYRAFLSRHGFKRPIWLTEIGWPASGWQLNDQLQADYLAQAYAQALASGLVEKIFWYSFKDDAASPDKSWGLVGWGAGKTDLAPRRPSFTAYATAARMLANATPVGKVSLGTPTVVETFDGGVDWTRSVSPEGQFTISGEQSRSGGASARMTYHFGSANQAVDFAPPVAIPLPGKPSELGVWVRGDGSGNYLSAWLSDRDGELFKVRLGAVLGAGDGWTYFSARTSGYYFSWEHAGGSPANGAVDYPVKLVAFRLENTPDEPPGSGTIYLDDLTTVEGPQATDQRFNVPGGLSMDIVWADSLTRVSLPTRSSTARVVDRDGKERIVTASAGAISLEVGTGPVYVTHQPADATSAVSYLAAATSAEHGPPACAASAATDRLVIPESVFFPETGHNLVGEFKRFWESHGAVTILGFPISEEYADVSSDGKPYRMQLFERARVEYHPENAPPSDFLLGLLGTWSAAGRAFTPAERPAAGSGGLYFDATQQSVGLFKDWWTRHGGVPVFGLPISGELQEKNVADGKVYAVQYFERNRLEYHPEAKGAPGEVTLGLLGVEFLKRQACK